MISLRTGGGKVPILNTTQHEATPYLMVDFPTQKEFYDLYAKHKCHELKYKYWTILKRRAEGMTLKESGRPFGITRERVRQIEARFQRLMGEKYTTQLEASISILSAHHNLEGFFSDSAMREKFPLFDDNR
jgi:hypothetical protein